MEYISLLFGGIAAALNTHKKGGTYFMELTLVFIVISAVRKSEDDEVLFLPLRGRVGGGRDKNKVNGSVLNCKSEFVGTKL